MSRHKDMAQLTTPVIFLFENKMNQIHLFVYVFLSVLVVAFSSIAVMSYASSKEAASKTIIEREMQQFDVSYSNIYTQRENTDSVSQCANLSFL